jgi:hypothetical protein
MAVGLLETGERYTSHSWWFLHIIHTSYTPHHCLSYSYP